MEDYESNPRGLWNENGLKYDWKNFINEFPDLENIGIDLSITVVCALVFVLCLFSGFYVMADRKRPLVVEFGTKNIFLNFMWTSILIPFKWAYFEGSTHMLTLDPPVEAAILDFSVNGGLRMPLEIVDGYRIKAYGLKNKSPKFHNSTIKCSGWSICVP